MQNSKQSVQKFNSQNNKKLVIVTTEEEDADGSATPAKSDGKDMKTPTVQPQLKRLFMTQLSVGRSGGARPKLNNLRTKMWDGSAITGSAGAALSTVINIRPAAASEFANFAALYDEFKVHGGTLHFLFILTNTGAVVPYTHGNIAYDPVDNGAYTTIITSLAASQKTGPISSTGLAILNAAAATTTGIGPIAHNKNGVHKFRFKCPKGASGVPANTQQVQTGNWCDTNISSAQGDYGYLKPIFELQTNTTIQIEYWIEYDIEFRSRT